MTPMFLVIVALGTTDLLFALDSIPAIYGLTQEPYLVFTANVFALMGLRQLYFLLGDLLKRLVYLSQGLAFILAFIGVKLVLHALHENELPFINGGEHVPVPEIPTLASLGVIVVTLIITTVASLYKTRVHDVKKEPARLRLNLGPLPDELVPVSTIEISGDGRGGWQVAPPTPRHWCAAPDPAARNSPRLQVSTPRLVRCSPTPMAVALGVGLYEQIAARAERDCARSKPATNSVLCASVTSCAP